MNATERVLTAIRFARPDRIPYWDNPWGDFEDNWRRRLGLPADTLAADYYHSDIFDEICPDERFFRTRAGIIRQSGDSIWRDNGWGWLVREPVAGGAVFAERVERRLPPGMTLDNLCFDPPDCSDRFLAIPALVKREKQAGRCLFAKSGGIYCRTQFLYGEEDLLADMVLEPERVHQVMARVADFLATLALETLRQTDAWQTGLWICDDMAGRQAPMFSPACFATFLLPLYKNMLARLRQAGCQHIFFHSDGNIFPLLDLLIEAGFEGFNPLEPRCGMDLHRLRQTYGRRIVLFGGVCNTEILPRGDLREIEAHVRPLLELARDGGIILGCASIGADVDPSVYDAYRQLIERHS